MLNEAHTDSLSYSFKLAEGRGDMTQKAPFVALYSIFYKRL